MMAHFLHRSSSRALALAFPLRRLDSAKRAGLASKAPDSSGSSDGTDDTPPDEFLGMYRGGASLRQAAPRRMGAGFRGRNAPSAPAPLSGPIARMATARPRGGSEAALRADYEENLRALYAEADGCLGAHLLWDGEKGEATSLTLWKSGAHLKSLTQTDEYARRMKSFAAHLVGVPEVRTLQLLASVAPVVPAAGGRLSVSPEA